MLTGSSVDDATLWEDIGWQSATMQATIAAESSGRFVWVIALVNGWTGMFTLYAVSLSINGGVGALTHRRAFFRAGTADLPASFDPASYGTTTGFLIPVGLAA